MIPLSRTTRIGSLGSALAFALAAPALGQIQLISPTTKVWRYSADNSDQYAAGFPNVDDSTWPEGLPLFGNDIAINYIYPFATIIPGSAAGVQTSYYRAHFDWAGATAGISLAMTNMIDDGIVIYLNGTEIVRWNINGTAFVSVEHDSQAAASNPGGEPVIVQHRVDLDALTNGMFNPLLPGDNVLAVSVHQAGTGSSDSVFGLAVYSSHTPPPPCVLALTPPATNTVNCRSVTFRPELPPDFVIPTTFQWYRNVGSDDEAIPGASAPELTLLNLSGVDTGQYFIRTTSSAGSCDSPRASLTVGIDTGGPRIVTVAIVAPNELLVTFDEPFLPAAAGGTADDTRTWSVTGEHLGALEAVSVIRAVAEPDHPTQVRLALAHDIMGGTYTTTQPMSDACAGAVTQSGQTGPILVTAPIFQWTDGRSWRFNQSGIDQGTAWRQPDFDDSSWELGYQGFGNESPNFPDAPDSLRTLLTVSSSQTTYYFRSRFRVPAGFRVFRFFAAVDDGAVVYVNGTEIGRINMPSGPIVFHKFAPTIPDGQAYQPADGLEIPEHLLVSGENVLAIEVHQSSSSSADVLLIAKITGLYRPPPPAETPVIATQPASLSVVEGRPFTLSVLANPTWANCQWSKDGIAIPGAIFPSYTGIAGASSAGVYSVALNSSGASVTSDGATVHVRRIVTRYAGPWKFETRSQDTPLSGARWYALAFDDAAWPTGSGPIGIETTEATLARLPPILTPLPGPPSGNNLTTYFRSTVTVPPIGPGESLFLTHIVDDGAVFYVDGNLAFSYNMWGGFRLSRTPAAGTTPGDGDAQEITTPILLSPGTHTLAVEVHQSAAGDADVLFGAEITRGPALPALHIVHESPGTVAITWTPTPGARLFTAPSTDGAFTAVSGNPQGRYTVARPAGPASTQAQFFRLGF